MNERDFKIEKTYQGRKKGGRKDIVKNYHKEEMSLHSIGQNLRTEGKTKKNSIAIKGMMMRKKTFVIGQGAQQD